MQQRRLLRWAMKQQFPVLLSLSKELNLRLLPVKLKMKVLVMKWLLQKRFSSSNERVLASSQAEEVCWTCLSHLLLLELGVKS